MRLLRGVGGRGSGEKPEKSRRPPAKPVFCACDRQCGAQWNDDEPALRSRPMGSRAASGSVCLLRRSPQPAAHHAAAAGAALVKLSLVPPVYRPGRPRPAPSAWRDRREIVVKFLALPPDSHARALDRPITEFSLDRSLPRYPEARAISELGAHPLLRGGSSDGREGLIRDSMDYEVGFGIIGGLIERLFFQRQLRGMFAYRRQALAKIFGD